MTPSDTTWVVVAPETTGLPDLIAKGPNCPKSGHSRISRKCCLQLLKAIGCGRKQRGGTCRSSAFTDRIPECAAEEPELVLNDGPANSTAVLVLYIARNRRGNATVRRAPPGAQNPNMGFFCPLLRERRNEPVKNSKPEP